MTDKTILTVDAISKAVFKILGPNPNREQLVEVALCIAHSVITQNETLDLETSMSNVKLFCSQLIELTGDTQQNKPKTSECGRLM